MRNELLKRIAASLRDWGQFMGSRWQNQEAESLAVQALRACAVNLKKHGEPFSWLMQSAVSCRQCDGTNNAAGLQILLDDGAVEIRGYAGKASPPAGVLVEGGLPQVLVVTDRMLTYAASLVGVSLDD